MLVGRARFRKFSASREQAAPHSRFERSTRRRPRRRIRARRALRGSGFTRITISIVELIYEPGELVEKLAEDDSRRRTIT